MNLEYDKKIIILQGLIRIQQASGEHRFSRFTANYLSLKLMLLNGQKIKIYEIIQQINSEIDDFVFIDNSEFKIIHSPSGFYFRIATELTFVPDKQRKEHLVFVYFIPKIQGIVVDVKKECVHRDIEDWSKVVSLFKDWVLFVEEETRQDVMLRTIIKQVKLQNSTTANQKILNNSVSEERFTNDEINELKQKLLELEEKIQSFNLGAQAEDAIKKSIQDATGQASRFNKKELSDLLFGALLREGARNIVNTENIKKVIEAFEHHIVPLFRIS